jgi:AcrR family transcriptional regulator
METMTPSTWATTVSEHKQRARAAIVEAALGLVAEHGLSAVTMSEIARATGMTRKTLYSYFPDVESVLVDHLEAEVARLREELAAPAAEPLARLARFLHQALATWSESPARPALSDLEAALKPENLARVREIVGGLRDDLHALLRDGAAAGQVRDDLDLDLAADVLLGVLKGAREHLLRGERPVAEVAEQLERLVVGSVRPAPDR